MEDKSRLILEINDLRKTLFDQFNEFHHQKETIKKQITYENEEQSDLFSSHYEQLKKQYSDQNSQLKSISYEFKSELQTNENLIFQLHQNVVRLEKENKSLQADIENLKSKEEKIKKDSKQQLDISKNNFISELESLRKELDKTKNSHIVDFETTREENEQKLESIRIKAESQIETYRNEVSIQLKHHHTLRCLSHSLCVSHSLCLSSSPSISLSLSPSASLSLFLSLYLFLSL